MGTRPTLEGTIDWIGANRDRVRSWDAVSTDGIHFGMYIEEILEVETPESRDRLLARAAADFDVVLRDGLLLHRHGRGVTAPG